MDLIYVSTLNILRSSETDVTCMNEEEYINSDDEFIIQIKRDNVLPPKKRRRYE